MASDSSAESIDSHRLITRKKRDNLPKSATETLKNWLRINIDNPYPTEEEKSTFVADLDLTQNQVNNWFINARRRYIKSSDKASKAKKGIKRKCSSKFEPENEQMPKLVSHIDPHANEVGEAVHNWLTNRQKNSLYKCDQRKLIEFLNEDTRITNLQLLSIVAEVIHPKRGIL